MISGDKSDLFIKITYKTFLYIFFTILIVLSLLFVLNSICDIGGNHNWVVDFSASPLLLFVLFLFLYILTIHIFRNFNNKLLIAIIASAILFCAYVVIRIAPLGDSVLLRFGSMLNSISISEALANFTYSQFARHAINISLVAPLFGFLTVFSYHILYGELYQGIRNSFSYQYYCLSFLTYGFSMLFFYDYIENTFLATPFAIFYLLFVIRYLRNNNPVMNLLLSSTMLALACLFHGQYTFLLPSLFAIIIFKSVANKKYSNALKDSVISIISIATIFIITFVLLNKFNYQIIVGNAGGAGDGSHFVPLSGASQTGYTPFLFLSLEHLTVISNIVFTCVPSFLILSGIMLYQFMFKKTGRYFLSPSDSPYDPILVACGSLSVCYVGFITLWRFDLGFPADIDLMLSSGFSLAILVSYLQFRLTDGNKYIMTISIVIGLSCTLLLESNFILSRSDESSNPIYGLQLQRPIHNIKMDGKTIEFSNYSKASKYTQAGWFLPNRYGITAYDKKAYLSFQMKENKLKSYKMMIKGKISYSNYRPAIVNIAINGEKSTSFAYAPAEETTKSIIVSADSIQKNNGIIIVRFEFPQKQNLFDFFVLRSIMFEPVD